MKKWWWFGICLFLFVGVLGSPQEEKREIEFHFEKARYNYKTKKYTFTKGELIDNSENMRIQADEIIYDEEKEMATAQGNLKFVDEENEITAPLLSVDLKEKIATLEGGVVIINTRKPKKEEKEEKSLKKYWKDRTVVNCHKVIYNYKDKIASLEGGVVITQEDKELKAEKATWWDKENKVILEGEVSLKDKEGQSLRCVKLIIFTKEGEEWLEMEGPLSGTFQIKEKKTEMPASP